MPLSRFSMDVNYAGWYGINQGYIIPERFRSLWACHVTTGVMRDHGRRRVRNLKIAQEFWIII